MTEADELEALRAQLAFYQRVVNVLDAAHDDETVKTLRRRVSKVRVREPDGKTIRQLGITL